MTERDTEGSGVEREEGGIAPNCAFCDSVARGTLSVSFATGLELPDEGHLIPICKDHRSDVAEIVGTASTGE